MPTAPGEFLNSDRPIRKGMYETFKRLPMRPVRRARGGSLRAVASDARRARRGTRGNGAFKPLWGQEDDPALQLRHDMVRAKISAFMERQDTVYRRYPLSTKSAGALRARITTYLHGDLRSALAPDRRADPAPAQ